MYMRNGYRSKKEGEAKKQNDDKAEWRDFQLNYSVRKAEKRNSLYSVVIRLFNTKYELH